MSGSANPTGNARTTAPVAPRMLAAVAAGVVAALGVVSVAERATRVLGWTVAAAVGATLVAAVIGRLEKVVGHRFAIVLTTLGFASGLALVAWRLFDDLRRGTTTMQVILPRAIRRLERSDGVGQFVREFGLRTKVERILTRLPGQIAGGTPAEVARTAGTRGAAFIAGMVLTCFLCAGGRRSFAGVVGWIPERRGRMLNRHATGQLIERAHRRASDVLFFSAVKAVVVGVLVGGALWMLSVPGATVFGAVFALASMVPGVGPVTAIVGLGVLSGIVHGPRLWLSLLVVAVVWIGDRIAHRRWVRSGMLDLGPVLGTVALVGGFEVGGLGTALCGVALAAFVAALWSEYAKLHDRWSCTEAETQETTQDQSSVDGPATTMAAAFFGAGAVTIAARGMIAGARSVHGTAVLVLIAFVLALAMERVVGPIARRLGGNRGASVAMVGSALALVVVAAGPLLAPAVANKAQSFGRELPRLTERLGEVPLIGGRFRDADVGKSVERWLRNLPADLGRDSAKMGKTVGGAVDVLVATVVVLLLALSMVVDGPRLVRSVRQVLAPRRRRTFDQSSVLVVDVVGRYFAGSLLVALLAGVMAASVGLALGVALAPLAALWIALTNLIPQVGGLLGGVVFVALGFGTSPTVGLACLAYFLTYQQFENHVIQPAVIGKAVSMSPAATMIVALVGGAALGVPGALIAVPVVGAVKVVAVRIRDNPRTSRS